MLKKITPEEAGVASEKILEMLEIFRKKNYAMHSLIMSHKGKVFFEEYWEPYHRESLHRIYSASKSFVSLAVGFLADEGKICLEDTVLKYFPEYRELAPEYLREQTICDMLKMSTASVDGHWMGLGIQERISYYFTRHQNRPSGTLYNYDSTGSYILGVIVEKITGMSFIEYLREKLFRKIGVSEEICCLKTPEGYSWGDSGIRCLAEDFWRVAQFACNLGKWDGEQLLSQNYMEMATSAQVFNGNSGYCNQNNYGYGYQFWKLEEGFSFNGMGNQYAICIPEKEFVFVCTADNQFNPSSGEIIFDTVLEKIVKNMTEDMMEGNSKMQVELQKYCRKLCLPYVRGMQKIVFQGKVNGVAYEMDKNPMKISEIMLNFDSEDQGKLIFMNQEGYQELSFGMGQNVYGLFPKQDMPNEVGGQEEKGYRHRYAASAAWVEECKLFIKVQIIDKYLGNLNITIGFKGEQIAVEMIANAEYFLQDFHGFAGGRRQKNALVSKESVSIQE